MQASHCSGFACPGAWALGCVVDPPGLDPGSRECNGSVKATSGGKGPFEESGDRDALKIQDKKSGLGLRKEKRKGGERAQAWLGK